MTEQRRSVFGAVVSRVLRQRRANVHPVDDAPALRLGYVVLGAAGVHPGSAHIRVTRRVNREVVAGRMSAEQIDPSAVAAGEKGLPYDVVLVQRDAVPASASALFLQAVRASGARLVAEVDDDFFSVDARRRLVRAEYDEARIDSVEAVVRAADAVIVSTEALARVVRQFASEVVVVPNELDPEFWGGEPGPTSPREPWTGGRPDADGRVHALYMGSATHQDDLELLRPVFDGLATKDGRPVVLDVVGVTGGDPGWFERVDIPEGHHPEFVRWLRGESGRWSVGLAPLADDPFNTSKSDLKFLEYTMLGLPTVASRSTSYATVPDHGGRTASSTDDWRRAILAAVDEGPSEAAASYVSGHRLLGCSTTWADVLRRGRTARPSSPPAC